MKVYCKSQKWKDDGWEKDGWDDDAWGGDGHIKSKPTLEPTVEDWGEDDTLGSDKNWRLSQETEAKEKASNDFKGNFHREETVTRCSSVYDENESSKCDHELCRDIKYWYNGYDLVHKDKGELYKRKCQ